MKAIKKAETLKNEAADMFKAGKYNEANGHYTLILDLFPNNNSYNATIYLNRAISYSKMKKFEESLKDIDKAISLNEKYAKAHVK